jgi:hypothetical protein
VLEETIFLGDELDVLEVIAVCPGGEMCVRVLRVAAVKLRWCTREYSEPIPCFHRVWPVLLCAPRDVGGETVVVFWEGFVVGVLVVI